MQNNYLAVSVLEDGKRLAYVLKVNPYENLLAVLSRRPNAEFINICSTRKEATQIANAWNEAYRKNNEYIFGERLYPASVQNT